MTIRLQEMHSSLVHLPVALLPVAIGTDLVGRATGNQSLLDMGRRTIGFAAAGAAASGVTGFIAQEEVNVEGRALDLLITHRNLNVTATLTTTLLAVWRARHERPSVGYLGVGLADMGMLLYSAYLGGTLVYHFGAGVALANGQWRKNPPELKAGEIGAFVRDAATDLVHGVKRLAQEVAQGKIVPWLTNGTRPRGTAIAGQTGSTSPERHETAAR